MNELIKIHERQFKGETIATISARDLHKFLEVGRDFTNWTKAQIERARLTEGRDYLLAEKGERLPSGMKYLMEYHLTLDAAKHIAMLSGSDKGFEVREYFLTCERKAKQAQDPMAILNDPAAMRGLLLNYSEKVAALQNEVAAALPKVQFHDAVVDDEGCKTMQDAAKILGTGGNRLYSLLREHGVLTNSNIPYQSYINTGHFRLRYTHYTQPDGQININARTLVTGSGLVFLFKLLRKAESAVAA